MKDLINKILSERKNKFQKLEDLFRLKDKTCYETIKGKFDDINSFSEKLWRVLHDMTGPKKCDNCKVKDTEYIDFVSGYADCCCRACSDHDVGRLSRIKNTNIKKYGSACPLKDAEVKKKSLKTLKENYGEHITNPGQLGKAKRVLIGNFYDELINNSSRNGNCELLLDKEEFIERKENSRYHSLAKFRCKDCNFIFDTYYLNGHIPKCPSCHTNKSFKSKAETEIIDYIKSLDKNINVKQTFRGFKNLDLDIYIEEKKIAFEFDGLYWHSEIFKHKNFHRDKTDECFKHDVRLYHIFEDEWKFKQRIVKNRIRNLLGLTPFKLYARKCEVKEISNKQASIFFEKYHIQGSVGSKISYGLFYKNRLVAVMNFGSFRKSLGRKHEAYCWELLRYATIGSFSVIGGAGKLLKHFETIHKPLKILSYADRRWSFGKLYKELGFMQSHISPPNYFYNYREKRYHRFQFRKSELHKKLKKFDASLSEAENMRANHITRIYDCGNLVFIKDFTLV